MYKLTCDHPGCGYTIPCDFDVVWYDLDDIITVMRDDEPYCDWGVDGAGKFVCPDHTYLDNDDRFCCTSWDGSGRRVFLKHASDVLEDISINTSSDLPRKPQEGPITEEIGHDMPTVEKPEPRFEVPDAAKGYIPTTDEVRDNYDPSMAPRFKRMLDISIDDPEYGAYILFEREMLGAEFDRWLRNEKAKAWEEGMAACGENHRRFHDAKPHETLELIHNPYESWKK
jgi:hypothetical protein